MLVQELIDRLSKLDPKAEVAIKDGSTIRAINLGPSSLVRHILTNADHEECSDFEHLPIGTDIYYMAFGNY